MPVFACLAAGGLAAQALPIAAAWHTLHLALKLIDDVQDGDSAANWSHLGADDAALVNAALGLVALSSLLLSRWEHRQRHVMVAEVQQLLLQMTAGQHADLAAPSPPDLAAYWKIAEAKSATFFAFACRNGARCATDDPATISWLERAGWELGLALQAGDDLDGFKTGEDDIARGKASLPTVFSLQYASPDDRDKFQRLLRQAPNDRAAARQLRGHVAERGGVMYTLAEMVRHRENARDALGHLAPHSHPFIDWMDNLFPAITSQS